MAGPVFWTWARDLLNLIMSGYLTPLVRDHVLLSLAVLQELIDKCVEKRDFILEKSKLKLIDRLSSCEWLIKWLKTISGMMVLVIYQGQKLVKAWLIQVALSWLSGQLRQFTSGCHVRRGFGQRSL